MEDGSEAGNYVTGNLGVNIRLTSSLLKSDLTPAVFWSASPNNYWVDNVACNSARFGHWFALPYSIGQADHEVVHCPFGERLGQFINNTYHSNAGTGLYIYPGWIPLTSPCDGSSIALPQSLYNSVIFDNGNYGLFNLDIGSLHYVGFSLVGNIGGEILIRALHVTYSQNPMFLNTILVGSLAASFNVEDDLGKCAITSPQLEYFYVKNVVIANYGMSGALQGYANNGGWTQRYEGVKWIKTIKRIRWTQMMKEIIWDMDGSVAGLVDSMLVYSYPSIRWPDACTVLDYASFDDSIRCGGLHSKARIRSLIIDGVNPRYSNVEVVSATGYYWFDWIIPVVTGINQSYSLVWPAAYEISLHLSDRAYLIESMSQGDRYDETVRIDYTPDMLQLKPYSYGITYASKRKIAPRNTTRLFYMADAEWNKHSNTLSFIVSTKGSIPSTANQFGLSLDAQMCPPKGCPIPPIPHIGTPMLWSRETSWPSYRIPTSGQSVTIDSNMWIVMDISPPTLGSLTIRGRLSFLSNASHPRTLKLRCKSIAIWGSMEIVGWGGSNESFVGEATVELYGLTRDSPVVNMAGINLGSKVIAVSGTLSARGTDKVTWIRLRSTVTMGDSNIIIDGVILWQVGDQVILSPTAYFKYDGSDWSSGSTSNDEVFKIKSISYYTESNTYQNYTSIVLDTPAKYTHLCTVQYDKSFCGAIGVLTKSIRFLSYDMVAVEKSSSYMFGASVRVIAIPADNYNTYGSVYLDNVEFVNFGQYNSEPALKFQYRDNNHPHSSISNCAFNGLYGLGIYADHAFNITIENNIIFGNYGGGVYISPTCSMFSVSNNLVVGTRRLPSTSKLRCRWINRIASFTIESPSGVVVGNLAAGSQDNGFCKMHLFIL